MPLRARSRDVPKTTARRSRCCFRHLRSQRGMCSLYYVKNGAPIHLFGGHGNMTACSPEHLGGATTLPPVFYCRLIFRR